MTTVSKKRKYNVLYTQTLHRETENFKIVLQVLTAMTITLFLIFFMLSAVLFFAALQAIHEVTAITSTGIMLKCIMTTNYRMFCKIKVSQAGAYTET